MRAIACAIIFAAFLIADQIERASKNDWVQKDRDTSFAFIFIPLGAAVAFTVFGL